MPPVERSPTAQLVVPQVLTGLRLERHDVPVAVAGETRPDAVVNTPDRRHIRIAELPFAIARDRIDRAQRAEIHLIAQAHPTAPGVALAVFERLVVGVVGRTRFAGRHNEQAVRGIVGRRIEIRASAGIGARSRSFLRRHGARHQDGPSFRADALRPCLLHERLRQNHAPVRAIEHVEEAVAVGKQHRLPRLAVDGEVGQHGHLRRIPVVDVVRRELKMPLDLAGVGIERDHRRGVEVVSLAHGAEIVGARVARSVEHEVLFGIVGAGHPDRSAAAQVCVGAFRPRLPARLIRAGHGIEPPRRAFRFAHRRHR